MLNYLWFFLAALFEIAGCYAFWLWLRQGKSALWVIPALISLTVFALLLTRVEAAYAGRAYAAYGGIYIVASIAWLGWSRGSGRSAATGWVWRSAFLARPSFCWGRAGRRPEKTRSCAEFSYRSGYKVRSFLRSFPMTLKDVTDLPSPH